MSDQSPRDRPFGRTDTAPWYRHFWPWFLISIPAAAIAGSILTGVLAGRHADSLVSDDWYREGKAINRLLARDQIARRRSISAELRIDERSGEVVLELAGDSLDALETLRLEISHPTLASRDRLAVLRRREDSSVFRGRLPPFLEGRWYATLTPGPGSASTPSEPWRLREEIRLPLAAPLRIGHERP
jgi:hypothetical protein